MERVILTVHLDEQSAIVIFRDGPRAVVASDVLELAEVGAYAARLSAGLGAPVEPIPFVRVSPFVEAGNKKRLRRTSG